MCNLYSITKGQQAIRQFTDATLDRTGNMPPLPGIYPDYAAPIVNQSTGAADTLTGPGACGNAANSCLVSTLPIRMLSAGAATECGNPCW